MKKYKFEEIREIEKELINDILSDSKKEKELDKLIKAYESNIKDEEKLKSLKYRYLLMLAMEDDFVCLNMFNLIPPEILEYFVPKLSILTRVHEVMRDE